MPPQSIQRKNEHFPTAIALLQSVDKIEVTASQSGYDARQDDTATKIVVNAEEIKRHGDTQVLDVLKRLPGVTVLGNSLRLRGLGNGYTQILIDGETTPYPIFRGRNEGSGNTFSNNANLIMKLTEGAKRDLKFNVNVSDSDNNLLINSFDSSNLQTLQRNTLGPSKDNSFSFAEKCSTPIVEGHSLLAGWDLGLIKNNSSTKLQETNIAAPSIDSLEEYRARVQKMAFFAQDEWNVLTNWSIYLGLRWEGIETTGSGNSINTVKNRSNVASPLFQTLWKFPDKSGRQFRFALTRTY